MTYEFDEAVAVTEGTANLPQRWTMGPGFVHGGLLMSVALAGAAAVSPRPDAVTMSAHFMRPALAGAVQVDTQLLKSGRSLATVDTRLIQRDKVVVATITTFGDLARAEDASYQAASMPDLADRGHCLRVEPDKSPFVPEMARNLELLLTPESAAWTQGNTSEHAAMMGWVRFADHRPIDQLSLPMFADALPPPVFSLGAPTVWTPTIEFTLHTRRIPDTTWLGVSFTTSLVGGGFFESSGTLWDEAGNLVAMSRQLQLIEG